MPWRFTITFKASRKNEDPHNNCIPKDSLFCKHSQLQFAASVAYLHSVASETGLRQSQATTIQEERSNCLKTHTDILCHVRL